MTYNFFAIWTEYRPATATLTTSPEMHISYTWRILSAGQFGTIPAKTTCANVTGQVFLTGQIRSALIKGIKAINGKPMHPQTQGKIERYHRTMKNVIKLDNYYSPQDLLKAIDEFVNYYNYERYHESLRNLTPADVYFGRDKKILKKRSKIKEKTMKERRRNYIVKKMVFDYEKF